MATSRGLTPAFWHTFPSHRVWRPIILTALYLLAWYPLDLAAQRFQTAPEISVWYPPFALDFVLLLVFGLRYWPVLLLNTPLHEFFVVSHHLPPLQLALFDLVTTAGNWGACYLLLHVLKINPRLRHLRDTALFVAVATFGAPLVIAALQVAIFASANLFPRMDIPLRMAHSWAGVATGTGLLAPPLLLLLRRWPQLWAVPDTKPDIPLPFVQRGPTRRGALKGTVEGSVLILALLIAYAGPRGATLDFTYVLFIPLLWIAARNGFARTTLVILAINIGAAILVQGQSTRIGGLALQFGLMTLTLSGLLLGASVDDRRQTSNRFAYQALHDPLTGLANRTLLGERTATALTEQRAVGLAMLLIDLDNFKTINDSLGHTAGDQVLVAVARRLADCVRPTDTVARLGGDEFALLLRETGELRDAEAVAESILTALHVPLAVGGRDIRPRASIGIAFHSRAQDADTETLVRDADVALYRAKAFRRGGYQVFAPPMHATVLERFEMEADLRRALEGDELLLHYQPIVNLTTGRIVGAEALIRWSHPQRGMLNPATFIPMAEETGLIVPLGRWVLRTACGEAVAWPRITNTPPLAVHVNLSLSQVQYADSATDVMAALRVTGLAADRLVLELTESVLAHDLPTTRTMMQPLRASGVRFALDDFGTGFSSLSYLQQLPLDTLKIDRSFIVSEQDDATTTSLVRTVTALGLTLGLTVVAEGIETATQAAHMRALGCAHGQGYYLAHPLTADAIRALIVADAPLMPAVDVPNPPNPQPLP